MIRVTYAHDLVETAVLEAERRLPAASASMFRRARNAVYRLADADAREAAFRELHRQWFASMRLHACIEQELACRHDLLDRIGGCRVLQASRARDEGADLFDCVGPSKYDRHPLLVIRLRPSHLIEPESLTALLRHELMHVGDILDPRFGYQRALPVSTLGPAVDTLVRDRYRVIWDATIDGRLWRQGLAAPHVRAVRRREFAAAFPMLGDQTDTLFDAWFSRANATHGEIVEFALRPPRGCDARHTGHCPLCRFPVAVLAVAPERMSPDTLRLIEHEHPEWHLADGLCAQCLDLYEARRGVRRHAPGA